MKKKIILGSIGAVVIVLLMTSCATATLQHIDSNIIITKTYEQKLTDAYNVAGGDFKILIGEIIDLLKTKKVVISTDIKNIIDENELSVSRVYLTRIISSNGFCPGACGLHLIRPLYWGGPFLWQADTATFPGFSISVSIGSDTYTYNHNGFAVSYLGYGCNYFGINPGFHIVNKCSFAGFGFIIMVS